MKNSFSSNVYTVFQKCLLITLRFTTEKPMVFMLQMEFCLIMSPLDEVNFRYKKIVQALVRIKFKKQKVLTLGNLYSVRDWGHAKDYVKSMWKIFTIKTPDDWVIATNKDLTVKQFINKCAKKLKINLVWKNRGINEIGVDRNTKKTIIKLDQKYFRPGEVDFLKGDYSKAKKILKWNPEYKPDDLIDDMISFEKKLYE